MRLAWLAALLILLPQAGATDPAPGGASAAAADLAAALGYLARETESGRIGDGALLVEAAAAAGLDPAAWPPGRPALGLLEAAERESPGRFTDAVRSLHARAAAGRLDATDARLQAIWDGYTPLAAADPGGRSASHDRPGNASGTPDESGAEARGQFGSATLANDDAWAILALHRAGVDPRDARLQAAGWHLRDLQDASGGWAWGAAARPGADMTGMTLAALAGIGLMEEDTASRGTAYLSSLQGADGGVAAAAGGAGNCDSTVWAVRGWRAAAVPVPASAWRFLGSLRQQDGSYAYLPGQEGNALCTLEATALLGDALAGDWDLTGYASGAAPAVAAGPGGALLGIGSLVAATAAYRLASGGERAEPSQRRRR